MKLKVKETVVASIALLALLHPTSVFAETGVIEAEKVFNKPISQDIVNKSDLYSNTDRKKIYSNWERTKDYKTLTPMQEYENDTEELVYNWPETEYSCPEAKIECQKVYYHYSKYERDYKYALEKGDIVTVNGRGSADSYGSTYLGKNWKDKAMVIVAVREDREYQYACAIVDDDPSSKDIMAWFKADQLELFTLSNEIAADWNSPVTSYSVPKGYRLSGTQGIKDTTDDILKLEKTNEEISSSYKIK